MLTIKDINQSFAYITTDIPDMYSHIMQKLTFQVPNYQFTPEFRSGNWDGNRKFYRIYNNSLIVPKGIVSLLLKQLKDYNPVYETITDIYYKNPTFLEFTNWVGSLGLAFKPYDYQIQSAFDSICKYRQTNLLATSAGKSLIIYIIARWLYEHNVKVVLIFPSIILVNQIKDNFEEFCNMQNLENQLKRYEQNWDTSLSQDDARETYDLIQRHHCFLQDIHLIGGEHKERSFDKPITATTWQSVYDHPQMFKEIPAIIIDEVHSAKASSFSNNIIPNCEKASFRLGFTGTLPPNVIDKMEIISALGPKKTYITAQQLIERGLATPVTINCMFLKYNEYDSIRVNNLGYQDEVKFLYNHQGRLNFVKKLLLKLQQSGNTIVLFDRIELAENVIMKLHEDEFGFIPDDLRKINDYNHMLITSKTKGSNRNEIIKYMEKTDNCLLFGTDSILSTGVSIKRLKNLVFLRSNKSPVRVIQSIGRLLRLHNEIEKVHAYDLVDDCRVWKNGVPKNNYCYTHFEERLGYYLEAGYPLKEINVDIN